MDIATLLSVWASTFYTRALTFTQDSGFDSGGVSGAESGSIATATGALDEATEQTAEAMDKGAAAAGDLGEKLSEHAKEVGETLNQDPTIQDVSAGILEPIYSLAEFMSWPAFYWLAFALMVAGVVSFAGQLLFAKFFLLFKLNLNFAEILSDLLGLAISVVGLVLTTQAATQNSTFAENSVLVVSAAIVGALGGFIFYWWGQKLEFAAANSRGASQEARA